MNIKGIFKKVDLSTVLMAAGAIVAVADALISNKKNALERDRMKKEAAEDAAKIVMDRMSSNED